MIYLRAARSTDAGATGAIFSEFTQTTDWMPHLHTGAEDIAHAGQLIERGWVTIAERDGAIVGFIAFDGAEIAALYVTARQRGRGVGKALLDHVCAKVPCVNLWTFQANARAIAFYNRHGFIEVTRTDGATTDEKLPDVRLEWKRKAA
ncbi:MAG: GNAT family N-acetyltransferase [Sulfitobacter sp.]